MRRVLLLLAVVLLLGLGLALWWGGRQARPWIEQQASEALGRAVHVDGVVRPLLSLYPGLHLGRVRIENPPGSAEPLLLEVGAVEARLDLPALLHRELRVRGLRLRDGRLVLGGAAAGRRATAPPSAPLALLRSLAGEQRLSNLVLEVVLEDGERRRIEIERARLRACGQPLEARVRLPAARLDVAGTLVCRASELGLDPVTASIGDSRLSGRLALRVAPAGLHVEAELETESLLADDVLDVFRAAPDAGTQLGLDAALPFDALEDLDLDLGVRADALYADAGVVRDLDARLVATPRSLGVSVARALVAEGSLAAELRVDAKQQPPALTLRASLADAQLAELVPETFLEGKGSASLDLRSSGSSPRELLARASGHSQLTLSEAVLEEVAFGALGRDLFSLWPWTKPEQEHTQLRCAVLRSDLSDGRGALLAVADTPRVTLAGGGSLDLGFLTADVLLKPRPRRASLGALKTPIRISGPLASLQVAVDKGELARSTGAALGRAFLNPLLALVDLGVRGNPCREALDEALTHPAAGGEDADAGPAPAPGAEAEIPD